ncbi:MAG: hypothetical protein U9N49_12695 [Campylobacterota bacterium]|nr:hypothetical protein [Campylobacterota bacterium]
MYKIIEETQKITDAYLRGFGFDEESIATLVAKSKVDLEKQLSQLEILLNTKPQDMDAINDTLHALKGLLFQVGSHQVGEKVNEIRSDINSDEALNKIKELLFYQ